MLYDETTNIHRRKLLRQRVSDCIVLTFVRQRERKREREREREKVHVHRSSIMRNN